MPTPTKVDGNFFDELELTRVVWIPRAEGCEARFASDGHAIPALESAEVLRFVEAMFFFCAKGHLPIFK